MGAIWSSVNTLQLISTQSEFNLNYPANSQTVMSVIKDLANLEIIPKEYVNDYLFFFLKGLEKNNRSQPSDQSQESDSTEQAGQADSEEEEESIVEKVGSLLLIACGIVLLLITLSVFKVLKKISKRIRRWYYKIYYALFWNGIIVYILESY
jgi:hypothetical protein